MKNRKVSTRINALMINLVERKNEHWKERLSTQSGPVSLQNLHKQHEQEMRKNQMDLQKYENDQKSNKSRNYKGSNSNQRSDEKQSRSHKSNQSATQTANGKFDEKSGVIRAKEFWGYLDAKIKIQEDYTVQHAVSDFKKLCDQCDPITFGQILIKTVYDCNKAHKDDRLAVAFEAAGFIKPAEFTKAFSERLNKSKDENSDFPLFIEFLSCLFLHVRTQSGIKLSDLQIQFKTEYDDSDREDLCFVYKQFFEEIIDSLKKQDGFNVSAFITEEIEPVLQKVDTDFSRWVNSVSK